VSEPSVIRKEPVIAAAIARILVAIAGVYGLALDADQVLTVLATMELIVAWWTRRRVSPVAPQKG
jgi:hypothetical protein